MGLTSLAGFFGTGGSDYQKYLKSKAQALFVETCLSPNLQLPSISYAINKNKNNNSKNAVSLDSTNHSRGGTGRYLAL